MTNLSFAELDTFFRKDDFPSIENDNRGIRYLKLRSMSRSETMEEFCSLHNIDISQLQSKQYLSHVFDHAGILNEHIVSFINQKYQQERDLRKANEAFLIDQLSRLLTFDWGGSFGNSLEKNIVDNYVKKIQSYDQISEEIEGRLLMSLRGYTLNSWYNHWTSILIEDLFKDHPNVLPTVGLVKKIDFFINDIPFDLKVTYFPAELMTSKLLVEGYRKESISLRDKCNELGIQVPNIDNTKELIRLFKELLGVYQQSITDFIRVERNNIESLKSKCLELNIGFDATKVANDLKRDLISLLREHRESIKTYISSVKYQTELSKLKSKCNQLNILVPDDLSDNALEQHLYNKLSEDHRPEAREFVNEIRESKRAIINEAEQNPAELKKWLYENQGEARFDASNRFFLILTDENEIYNSWKLKRSIPFLRDRINSHLDTILERTEDLNTEFYWHAGQQTYNCKSDILFIKQTE
ncbi:MAG: hypothetical protein JNL22_06205 [Bacteroidales bacterium]|nr:hypothetical protein [Bacteroidales bacterium]